MNDVKNGSSENDTDWVELIRNDAKNDENEKFLSADSN